MGLNLTQVPNWVGYGYGDGYGYGYGDGYGYGYGYGYGDGDGDGYGYGDGDGDGDGDGYGCPNTATVAAHSRGDGYLFWLRFDGTVKAGCRDLTIDAYRAHVAAEYPSTPKAEETLRILDHFDAALAARKG